jgi:hypothetical protein
LGRTVEKYLTPQTQRKEITKEQHITQPCFIGAIVGLFENTLRPKHKEGITKRAAHHSIPAFIGKGRTVENTLKTKRKERNHKEQHITQSLLS